jgi:glycine/D-amino acid oxidase-like deaminating enzyme
LQNGVAIYGNSPAVSISQKNAGWRIKSLTGEIQCRKLVIGMNGYTDATWAGLAQNIVPVASLISATEPLPESVAQEIIPERNAVSESGGVPHYYRVDENNRMVFGGRGTIFGHTGNLDTSGLRKQAIKLYPQLRHVKWEYDWGGYVAMTTHHRPMLLRLADNAFSGLGYNGRGLDGQTARHGGQRSGTGSGNGGTQTNPAARVSQSRHSRQSD